MPGRKFDAGSLYRYGFNGKENDNEVKGEANQQDYGMRIFDPRIGRFLSEDPITEEYPELTPYQFASNTPLQALDLDGLEADFSAAKADKLEYEDDDKWYHKIGKFATNSGISVWNGLVGIAETGVNVLPVTNAFNSGAGYEKVGGEIKEATINTYNWLVNTSGSEKWQDIKHIASDPHTYEDVAAILVTRKITKAPGPKTKPITSTQSSVTPKARSAATTKAKGLGNPYKNKTLAQVKRGMNAQVKKGKLIAKPSAPGNKAYQNTKSKYSYNLDPGGTYKKGIEPPHVDVNYPNPKPKNVPPKKKLPTKS